MNNAEVFVGALFELVFEHARNDQLLREVRSRGDLAALLDENLFDLASERGLLDPKHLTDDVILEECKNRDMFTIAHADNVHLLAECTRRGIRPPQSDEELIDEFVKRGIKPLVVTWGDVSEYLNHADPKELRDVLQMVVTRL